ncbi:MAG: adenine phosphoribosyltransferase, partial [Schleiferilactobacillus harbinensis]
MSINFKDYVANVQDFPEPGIIFRDISPLMEDGRAYAAATNAIVDYARAKNVEMVCGPEARGFIVGCPVAYKLGV